MARRLFAVTVAIVAGVLYCSAFVFQPNGSFSRYPTALQASVGKRGKSTVPPRVRHDIDHGHNARELRNEGVVPQAPGEDGLPVFNLFVRAHRRHVS